MRRQPLARVNGQRQKQTPHAWRHVTWTRRVRGVTRGGPRRFPRWLRGRGGGLASHGLGPTTGFRNLDIFPFSMARSPHRAHLSDMWAEEILLQQFTPLQRATDLSRQNKTKKKDTTVLQIASEAVEQGATAYWYCAQILLNVTIK